MAQQGKINEDLKYFREEINLSPDPIEYTAIDSPDYFIIVSEEGLKKTASVVSKLPASTHLIVDEDLQLPATKADVKGSASKKRPFHLSAKITKTQTTRLKQTETMMSSELPCNMPENPKETKVKLNG